MAFFLHKIIDHVPRCELRAACCASFLPRCALYVARLSDRGAHCANCALHVAHLSYLGICTGKPAGTGAPTRRDEERTEERLSTERG